MKPLSSASTNVFFVLVEASGADTLQIEGRKPTPEGSGVLTFEDQLQLRYKPKISKALETSSNFIFHFGELFLSLCLISFGS